MIAVLGSLAYTLKSWKRFYVTGRPEKFREVTVEWLRSRVDPDLKSEDLFMRPDGDVTKSRICKEAIYNKHIADKYSVQGWFDDDEDVIKHLLVPLNIPCFTVNAVGKS